MQLHLLCVEIILFISILSHVILQPLTLYMVTAIRLLDTLLDTQSNTAALSLIKRLQGYLSVFLLYYIFYIIRSVPNVLAST